MARRVKAIAVQTLLTEAGLDMSQWPTEAHLVSRIGLSPRNEQSVGRVLNRKRRKVVSGLAAALRLAASTLSNSDSYLGAPLSLDSSRDQQKRPFHPEFLESVNAARNE